MGKSIRISKEHGLNPTLCTCFYCGKETGEIALLGNSYDGEAPSHMCMSLEPCDECKRRFEGNVIVLEADKRTKPTGRWMLIKKEEIEVPNDGIVYCYENEFEGIIERMEMEEKK